jgi:hypothetical protein
MRIGWRLAVLLALLALSAGCGVGRVASGDSYGYVKPALSDPGMAQVIVYRPKQSWRERAGSYPEVFINGDSVGTLRYNGYLVHEVAPGAGQLRITGLSPLARKWKFRDRELPVSARAGETLFYRVVVRYDQSSNTLANPGNDCR